MSAAFTPGPWSVGPAHVVAQRSADNEGRRTTRFVAEATLSAPYVEGEREANACLIAAAPELYSVLLNIDEWLHSGGSMARADDLHCAAIAVLAKARGEQ